MVSRVMIAVVSFVASAAGARFNVQCTPAAAVCSGKCCGVSWTLGGDDGQYTCSNGGVTCGLCGQAGVEACSFTVENSGAPVPSLVDKQGNTVDTPDVVMGSGTGRLRPTWPSSGVSMVLGTYNGMYGWPDIPASSFYGFNDFLSGLTATVPSFYTASGYTVRYSCRKPYYAPADFKGCDIFFFVYKCPPCQRQDGNIHAQLLAMDEPRWFAGQCGPSFKLDRDYGVSHEFTVWHADVADGSVVSLKMDGDIEFIFWAMVGKNVVCSTRLTEDACAAATENCEWLDDEGGVCRPRGCPERSPFHGAPTPRCQVCVDDEEEFIPRVQQF